MSVQSKKDEKYDEADEGAAVPSDGAASSLVALASSVTAGPAVFAEEAQLRRLPLNFPGNYRELKLVHEEDLKTVWCFMNPLPRPNFTFGLLRDAHVSQCAIRKACLERGDDFLDYYVLASDRPGVFNLGGDLDSFREAIIAKDRTALLDYAFGCINIMYSNYLNFDTRIITIALIEGDCLGGGFEAAMSCNVLIAEAGTKFGLPEVLFNLFPGMGALSVLSRRLTMAAAEEIIRSGRIYQAEELLQLGLVNQVVPKGEGRQAVREYITRNRARHNSHFGIYDAARNVNPLLYDELKSVIEVWVDTALRLSKNDMRKMERILRAQSVHEISEDPATST